MQIPSSALGECGRVGPGATADPKDHRAGRGPKGETAEPQSTRAQGTEPPGPKDHAAAAAGRGPTGYGAKGRGGRRETPASGGGREATGLGRRAPEAPSAGAPRHRRRQTRRTALPEIGRSRTWTLLRPCPRARTPQVGHPITSRSVSTRSQTSPGSSVWERTTNPAIPSSAVTPPLRSSMPRVLSTLGSQQPQESRVTGPYWWMPMGRSPDERLPTPHCEEPCKSASHGSAWLVAVASTPSASTAQAQR